MFACGRRLFEIAKLNAPLDPEAEFLRLRNAIIDEVARVASADPDVTLDRAAVIEIIGQSCPLPSNGRTDPAGG